MNKRLRSALARNGKAVWVGVGVAALVVALSFLVWPDGAFAIPLPGF